MLSGGAWVLSVEALCLLYRTVSARERVPVLTGTRSLALTARRTETERALLKAHAANSALPRCLPGLPFASRTARESDASALARARPQLDPAPGIEVIGEHGARGEAGNPVAGHAHAGR